jgi:hypothetical protein
MGPVSMETVKFVNVSRFLFKFDLEILLEQKLINQYADGFHR